MSRVLDPNVPPPLPREVVGRAVTRVDGTKTWAVTVRDAARLMGRALATVEAWVTTGHVDICYDGDTVYVLTDSLWLLVPEEERRAGL